MTWDTGVRNIAYGVNFVILDTHYLHNIQKKSNNSKKKKEREISLNNLWKEKPNITRHYEKMPKFLSSKKNVNENDAAVSLHTIEFVTLKTSVRQDSEAIIQGLSPGRGL